MLKTGTPQRANETEVDVVVRARREIQRAERKGFPAICYADAVDTRAVEIPAGTDARARVAEKCLKPRAHRRRDGKSALGIRCKGQSVTYQAAESNWSGRSTTG